MAPARAARNCAALPGAGRTGGATSISARGPGAGTPSVDALGAGSASGAVPASGGSYGPDSAAEGS